MTPLLFKSVSFSVIGFYSLTSLLSETEEFSIMGFMETTWTGETPGIALPGIGGLTRLWTRELDLKFAFLPSLAARFVFERMASLFSLLFLCF